MQEFRVNHRIRSREVLVISADGVSLGVMSIQDALSEAKRSGLDLVEVSPNARPPVCKVLDFGKFRYEVAKREKDARKHNVAGKVKELKFHVNIDANDYLIKMKKAEVFMLKGMKVKISMMFRGREMQHQQLGKDLMKRIQNDLSHVGIADAEPKLLGKNINMMLTPHPAKKRARKFTIEEEDEQIENESADEV